MNRAASAPPAPRWRNPSGQSVRRDNVVAERTPLYGAECPGAIVSAGELAERAHPARHAWPPSEAQVAADPIERTAIIFVGQGLAAEGIFAKAHSMTQPTSAAVPGPCA